MCMSEMNQAGNTVSIEESASITVMGEASFASPLECDAFLKMLADITKRILTEKAPSDIHDQAS